MSTQSDRPGTVKSAAPWVCTLVLLAGFGADRWMTTQPNADAEQYHARVREAAAQVPHHVGKWLGEDGEVPPGAVKLLKPNVIMSRTFTELGTRRRVTLLVVHCRDARDILGHYPPVCYVVQGWTMLGRSPQDWVVNGQRIEGTQYRFHPADESAGNDVVIDNFMVLPAGRTARDMDDVEQSAKHSTLKHFGAGQVQVVSDANLSEEDRRELFGMLINEAQPLLEAIMQPIEEVGP